MLFKPTVTQPINQTPYDLNNELLFCYLGHGLNNEPFNERTNLDNLNTELVCYSDPHRTGETGDINIPNVLVLTFSFDSLCSRSVSWVLRRLVVALKKMWFWFIKNTVTIWILNIWNPNFSDTFLSSFHMIGGRTIRKPDIFVRFSDQHSYLALALMSSIIIPFFVCSRSSLLT